MYLSRLSGENFRSFKTLDLEFQTPDESTPLSNINLLVGPNGSGKTSLMRAIALACCGEALKQGGFLSHYNVLRSKKSNSPRKASITAHLRGQPKLGEPEGAHEMVVDIERLGDAEVLEAHSPQLEKSNSWQLYRKALLSHGNPGWFLTAYHASRRAESTDGFSKAARSKARSERYGRVAGLFEEHVDLVPLASWLPVNKRMKEITEIISTLLPGAIRVVSTIDDEFVNDDLLYDVNGVLLPFSALSDGYRAFLAWVGDLLYCLMESCPPETPLGRLPGVVLIDEVDLHLHPAWQREVLHRLSAAFPALQIIATTHSPLVLGSVRHRQVHILRTEQGLSHVERPTQSSWGLSADQLLASSYFGLDTTRDKVFAEKLRAAQKQATEGSLEDALAYTRMLSRGGENP